MENKRERIIRSIRTLFLTAAAVVMVGLFSNVAKAYYMDDQCPAFDYGIHYNPAEATLKQVQGIATSVNKMPLVVRNYFETNSVKIYMFNEDWDRSTIAVAYMPAYDYELYTGKMKGIKWPGEIHVYTKIKSVDYDAVIHEFGHQLDYYAVAKQEYYDYSSYGISETSEWAYYYATYAAKLKKIDGLARSNMYNAAEAWAEAVRLLYSKPDKLIAVSADLYNYVVAQITRVIGADATPSQMQPQAGVGESKAGFDYVNYADTYPDLKAAFGYDKDMLWNHYQQFGKAEGRIAKFNPVAGNTTGTYSQFDYKAYADTYPDLLAAFGYNKKNLWNHYQKFGKNEGRIAYFN